LAMEGRSLIICRALDKPSLEVVKQRQSDAVMADKRNLHLANEGCKLFFFILKLYFLPLIILI